MTCPRCRPSPRLRYTDAGALAEAHIAAGIRQTQCPGCGLWRWPWECEEPERVATGLRWRLTSADWWDLLRGRRIVGSVYRSRDGVQDWWAIRRGVVPSVGHGIVSDCARALVVAVSGPRDKVHP